MVIKMKVEEVVRDKFNLFKDMMYTNTSDENEEKEDYLHLLNLSTDDERIEIFKALKIIEEQLNKIAYIQDKCWSR